MSETQKTDRISKAMQGVDSEFFYRSLLKICLNGDPQTPRWAINMAVERLLTDLESIKGGDTDE